MIKNKIITLLHRKSFSPLTQYIVRIGLSAGLAVLLILMIMMNGCTGSAEVGTKADSAVKLSSVNRLVQFSIQVPKSIPAQQRVRETFPLRNYVFFDEGSSEIPLRYVSLTKDEASKFSEEQLQEVQPLSMKGRSGRQLMVYYNILNILGDRMKKNPQTTVSLSGASEREPEYGKKMAESVKHYLVEIFGIDESRISTRGRDKPTIPSVVPSATKELALLSDEDRRVDIESSSPEMMLQVGGDNNYMMKPVQIVATSEDPVESRLVFSVTPINDELTTWSLEVADSQGIVQRFGPTMRKIILISGNKILGDRLQGDYAVTMLGTTKSGNSVTKERFIHLVRREGLKKETVRFSILFDFDKSKTISSYEKFLADVVAPLIPDSSTVAIQGYTDIIGDEEYNDSLSTQRVQDAKSILERALANSHQHDITLQTFSFGEDSRYSLFDNYFPEQRFYNRTVVIDITPD